MRAALLISLCTVLTSLMMVWSWAETTSGGVVNLALLSLLLLLLLSLLLSLLLPLLLLLRRHSSLVLSSPIEGLGSPE